MAKRVPGDAASKTRPKKERQLGRHDNPRVDTIRVTLDEWVRDFRAAR
jgi:hypothetical protein